MIAYVLIGAEGAVLGGGQVPDDRPLPEGAVEVLAEEYGLRLAQRWDGESWQAREAIEEGSDDPAALALIDLADARARAAARLHEALLGAHREVVADLPGQDAIYSDKRRQAAEYVAAALAHDGALGTAALEVRAAPDPADWPFVAADVGRTAPDAWGAAQAILNRAALWTALAVALDAIRRDVADALLAARDIAEVGAAEAAALEALAGVSRSAG